MPAPLPRIGQAVPVICNGNLLCGKVKHQRLLRLTLLALALLPIHFYFETGCSVYNLNELQAESFKLLLFCSELNKVTKHML